MRLCRELGVLYIDTVVEPWAGHYFDLSLDPAGAAPTTRCARRCGRRSGRNPGGTTAVSCCGANPGMVSWLLKEALLRLAADTGAAGGGAARPGGWARLMQAARRQGRAHRRARHPGRARRQADRELRQHLVGRGLHLRELPAGRARLGQPRALVPAERPPAPRRLPGGDLSRHAGDPDQGPYLDAGGRAAVRLPRHPQRGDLDRRLLHRSARATRRSSGRPATTPTILATRRC